MYYRKNIYQALLLPVLLLGSDLATAATVNIPNTFTSGTAAVAAQVNGNFTAVKTAVDDNDGRVTTNASGITANGAAITSLKSANSAVGTATISPAAFINQNTLSAQENQCQWAHAQNYSYFREIAGATSASCDPFASIQLPHGKTLAELVCSVYDNSGVNTNAFQIDLRRVSMHDGARTILYTTPSTIDSTSVQRVSDNTIATGINRTIDNSAYVYELFADFSSDDMSNLGTNGRIYGCSVNYE
jgi:hypothetical protein